MDPQTLSPIQTARTAVATAISSWKEKADFNCAAYTAAHRIGLATRLFGTLVSTTLLQIGSRGIQLPAWLSAALTVLVLVVAAFGEYKAEMARKHDYEGRWPRIRQALDGMIADQAAELVQGGVFAKLDDQGRADLLQRRTSAWIARARGMAALSPIPEK